ncbi:MAG: hypothetical protein ACE5JP_10615 [Candidatus Bipolaricaulia bacterium]
MTNRPFFPLLVPLMAVLFIAVIAGGLGALFLEIGRNGTIALGLVIVILVPAVSALLAQTRR